MQKKMISASVNSKLKERLVTYIDKTYGRDESHGKITEIITMALDAFLTREGY